MRNPAELQREMELETNGLEGNPVVVPDIIRQQIDSIPQDSPLRRISVNMSMPLQRPDLEDLVKLAKRYDYKEPEDAECYDALSLPQLGINKRAFVFEVKKHPGQEEDIQEFERDIWINPIYKPVKGATLDEDYEICVSLVTGQTWVAVPVLRWSRIFYRAYDYKGRILEGEAHGYAARVLQHEIDHLDGKLSIDFAEPRKILTIEEYGKAVEENTLPPLHTGIIPDCKDL